MKKTILLIGVLVGAVFLMAAAVIGYQDWQTRAAPGSNPASGYMRIWADTATSTFKCITSAGASCTFAAATSGTVTSIATTSPITGGPITGSGTIACGTCLTAAVTSVATSAPLGGGTITGTGTLTCTTCAVTIANGTSALGTSAIGASACATVVTTTATGTATTDNIMADFNADPSGVTGYVAGTMLTIIKYPTANNVNFLVCNNTAGSITPGAVTMNWRVVR